MSTPTQRSFWFRNRFRLLQIYLALLLLSHLLQWTQRQTPSVKPPLPAPEGLTAPPILRTLVLLDPLDDSARRLEEYVESQNLPLPQLPGLNLPTRDPVCFDTIASDLAERYFHPALPPVLVIANGHAGAIAVHLAAAHPEHIAALVLLDATGVQELSLLGEYHLNYALYAISGTALNLYHSLVPHFNAFPRLRLQQSQIRLLRQSDRRALRPLFDKVAQPVLILQHPHESLRRHAAREHGRLLPQSHLLLIPEDVSLEDLLHPFQEDLLAGRLPERAEAAPDRLEAATLAFEDTDRPRVSGIALVLLLLAIAVATLVTEDLTCALTGLMIANGNLIWIQGLAACVLGILFFDGIIYATARKLGRPALHRIPLRWLIDPVTLRETETWFDRRVGEAIFITRFIPGTRLPAYVAAGLLGVPAKTFLPLFILATLVWTPLILWLSVTLAEQALEWIALYQHTAPALILAGLAFYLLFSHVLLPACSWRGRRKLRARWNRLTQPEYWPNKILYLPLLLRLLFRSLRRGKHFLDFTACNPGMPASGLVGESKHVILDRIGDRNAVLPYLFLPASLSHDERLALARDWIAAQKLSYPFFFKPDVGQHGHDVRKLSTLPELKEALSSQHGDNILQAAATGREYSVFYIREPEQETGYIYAITRKTLPAVTGDGKRKLEDLILAHPRAVNRHRAYAERLGEQLYRVPAAGEVVPLSFVGNHAMGVLFEDGMPLCTPELEARIDAISKSYPGFHFGRYDLFAPDDETFSRGEGLQIVELNGVTSEATSVYTPGCSFRAINRNLNRQWAIACRIGKHHREQGVPIMTLRELLESFDRFCREDRNRKLRNLETQNP